MLDLNSFKKEKKYSEFLLGEKQVKVFLTAELMVKIAAIDADKKYSNEMEKANAFIKAAFKNEDSEWILENVNLNGIVAIVEQIIKDIGLNNTEITKK